ncbi:glycosyltransferase family 2 protein [Desemzia incerta]|uniref:glycosyltransferase family 2 protein n=1 Tax=Desemzia incerta TaxID=82801 RepID=UPI0024C2F660|nr:glycosyltransferase family 2 protein [Desemzia incerta]WHZ31914.1 glycosyltransferase family 2 protein [Desemzia incerta]
MDHPLVSVIIPTIKRPYYLKRAIESVLKQSYDNLEIIVVIDGMSSKTVELIDSYKNKSGISLQWIETGKKVGGSEARNIGAQKAQGDFIALLDDDDEWLGDKIVAQLNLIKEYTLTEKDSFVCFTSIYVYESSDQKKYKQLPIVSYLDSRKERIADYLFEANGLKRIGLIQTSTILTPRHLLLQYPFTKGLPKHQDWDWLLKVDQLPDLQVLQVNQPMVIYHSDVPKEKRIGLANHWRFSEEWLSEHRDSFGKNAYETFLLDILIPGIITDESLSGTERTIEIKRILYKLSLRAYSRPFTWKMLSYSIIRKNDYFFKKIQHSSLLMSVKNWLF